MLLTLLIAIIGATVGSFLTLISYRLPRGENIVHVPSRCPACGTRLKVRDLIPVLSWLLGGGKARCCGARISARYPLIELAAALSAALVFHAYGVTWVAVCLTLFSWCALCMIVTDLEHYFLPDGLQIALAITGLAYGILTAQPLSAITIGGGAGLLIGLTLHYGFQWITGKAGLGLGDVKLLAVSGIWLASLIALVPYLFFSGALGMIFALIWRMLGRGAVFPFGPALLIALALCVLAPASIDAFWNLYPTP